MNREISKDSFNGKRQLSILEKAKLEKKMIDNVLDKNYDLTHQESYLKYQFGPAKDSASKAQDVSRL